MPSESYWLQLEAEARETAGRSGGSERWTNLADLYRENAEAERKRLSEPALFVRDALGERQKEVRQFKNSAGKTIALEMKPGSYPDYR